MRWHLNRVLKILNLIKNLLLWQNIIGNINLLSIQLSINANIIMNHSKLVDWWDPNWKLWRVHLRSKILLAWPLYMWLNLLSFTLGWLDYLFFDIDVWILKLILLFFVLYCNALLIVRLNSTVRNFIWTLFLKIRIEN